MSPYGRPLKFITSLSLPNIFTSRATPRLSAPGIDSYSLHLAFNSLHYGHCIYRHSLWAPKGKANFLFFCSPYFPSVQIVFHFPITELPHFWEILLSSRQLLTDFPSLLHIFLRWKSSLPQNLLQEYNNPIIIDIMWKVDLVLCFLGNLPSTWNLLDN